MTDATYTDQAASWAKSLLHKESRGPGDTDNAMRRLSQRYGIPYGSLWTLRYRKPKDVFASVYFALQNAYAAECERQLKRLQHDIEITKRIAGPNGRAVRAAEALVEKAHE